MLPDKNRLKNSKEIQEVFKKGETSRSGFLFLKKIKKKDNQSPTKIAILVGKNFSQKATRRNRMKRVIRESIKNHLKNLKSGYNIVLWIKLEKNHTLSSKQKQHQEINSAINSLLDKSRLKFK